MNYVLEIEYLRRMISRCESVISVSREAFFEKDVVAREFDAWTKVFTTCSALKDFYEKQLKFAEEEED